VSIFHSFGGLSKAQVIQVEFLGGAVGSLDDQTTFFADQGQSLISYLPYKKHRFSGRFAQSQMEFVLGELVLEDLANIAFHAKKAVGGEHTVDALVGSVEIEVVYKVREPLAAVLQFLGLDAVPEFGADGFPKAFAFAEGLRVMCSGDDVFDALAFEDLFELTFAAPGKVLPALIRKHF